MSRLSRQRVAAPLAQAIVISATLASGCADPLRIVSVPREPARTGVGDKASGTAAFMVLEGDRPRPELGVTIEHVATLAQSGDGGLGDRVFRENEHSLLEGCRWVAKGRVCNLVHLPDGKFLGGGVDWVIPKGAAATARAGGWLARGVFMSPAFAVGGTFFYVDTNKVQATPVFVGDLYHCRFADAGPTCIPLKLETSTTGYVLLGAFSLKDGDRRDEVLWVGLFDATPGVEGGDALGVKEIQRCTTREDLGEVTCKKASMQ